MSNTTEQQPLLQLFREPLKAEGEPEPVMGFRWCVSPRLADLLKNEGITKPYVLISVRPYRLIGAGNRARKEYSGESHRKLVPLLTEFAYVPFSRPGLNEVSACIVHSGGGRLELGSVFLKGRPYSYEVDVYEYDGRLSPGHKERWPGRYRYEGHVIQDSEASVDNIDVDKEHFAKDWPEWTKTLVNKFGFSTGPDQCGMRKRFPASVFIALLYLPFAYVVRIMSLIWGLWFGMRGLSFRGFAHPIQQPFTDVTNDIKTSIWFKKKDNRTDRSLLQWPLNPVTPVILGAAMWAIGTFHVTRDERVVGFIGWEWWQYFAVSALIHIGIVVLALVLMGVAGLVSAGAGTVLNTKLNTWWKNQRASTKKAKAKAAEQRKLDTQKALERELTAMICSAASRNASLDALPKQKQTVWLRAQRAKRKVCKPFAH